MPTHFWHLCQPETVLCSVTVLFIEGPYYSTEDVTANRTAGVIANTNESNNYICCPSCSYMQEIHQYTTEFKIFLLPFMQYRGIYCIAT